MPNKEFGDFQTPLRLALQCLSVLEIPYCARILEPTCGSGSFLEAAAKIEPSSERYGIEINPHYSELASKWGKITTGDIFQLSLSDIAEWTTDKPILVIGNPPWVTSAGLKRMNSTNIPVKDNFKQIEGLNAILGSSNFDVCEYIIIKILKEFSQKKFTLGMLCKTQVARNVIEYASKMKLPITHAKLYRVNTLEWFNVKVDACWFILSSSPNAHPDYTVAVYKDIFNHHNSPDKRFGIVNSRFVSDLDKYISVSSADGKAPYEWRSGLKHDASNVFELLATPKPKTKYGESLDIESEYLFPLLKGTDIFQGHERELSRWIIVPQKKLGADTEHLRLVAPKLWHYLETNASILDNRKSSIYRNRPRFSVFGLGDYTFAPYKVAISGLHKKPIFRLVTPIDGLPVVLDDTCYLLPFHDATEAAVVAAMLNSPECVALIESLVFWDSKRPITKKLLSRLDLNCLQVDKEKVIQVAHTNLDKVQISFDDVRANSLFGHFGRIKGESPSLF